MVRENVLKAIVLAYSTLRRAKIEKPKIGVSSLNPHEGEGGLFGPEETEYIAPAIEDAKGMGIDAVGPYPADTIFLDPFFDQREIILVEVELFFDGRSVEKL